MSYKNKDKQREAVKLAVKKHRQGITSGITCQGITPVKHMKDAMCNTHLIDYEGRRKAHALLESWRNGMGNEYQHRLGMTAHHYTVVKGIDLNSYLGYVPGYVGVGG